MPDPSPSTLTVWTPTSYSSEEGVAATTAGSSPHAVTCQHCDTHYFSRPRTHNLPIVGSTLYK